MKAKRQHALLELIAAEPVDTQEKLQRRLNELGFAVTQATVSRDIKELKLFKTMDNGAYRYTTVQREHGNQSERFRSVFVEAVVGIESAGNLVVIRCLAGMGNAACAALDALHIGAVVGTLAGDDTFICITKDVIKAEELAMDLKKELRHVK